jgi:bifunctional DNA-binding transcriptional regulator/antitoxin component of YhaV-PrlF toxin-antitoxin module
LEYYKRALLGKSKVADGTIRIPKRIMENYNIKKGDTLQFYPPDVELPDREMSNILAVLIVRATTAIGGTAKYQNIA